MKASRSIANFDSSAAMMKGLSRFLKGKDFPALGVFPFSPVPLTWVNWLPTRARELVYTWSGWGEAVPPSKLGEVSAEAISQWVVNQYPRRPYPAAAIGSSNGALTHLWTALGIPWLPQTFLVPARRHGISPDDPKSDMEWGRTFGPRLLNANPELQLNHMHDPNQDRLMIQHMTYFRVKRLTLGEAYGTFLKENLAPGGTLFVVDCQLKWPTVRVGDRHVFQCGALGGATPSEYLHGSPRIEDYLRRYRSPYRKWDYPKPDAERPEAEWGFEPSLLKNLKDLAADRRYRLRRVAFRQPEDTSPLVADLHRWWYKMRGIEPSRLLAESFILMEPWWVLQTGCIPFWMVFNMEPSAEALERYIETSGPFDEIYVMLFSHGVHSKGLALIDRWESILKRARKRGDFMGVARAKFPRDFGSFVRYHTAMKKMPVRYSIPDSLSLSELEEFLRNNLRKYAVTVDGIDQPNGSQALSPE